MPCNCDYMEPETREIETSRVACLLDEIEGKTWSKSEWGGYHPDVYCKYNKQFADDLVSQLCSKLKNLDVTQYSLEMQIWWRDHQIADKNRKKQEKEEKEIKRKKEQALNKLFQEEKEILGLI